MRLGIFGTPVPADLEGQVNAVVQAEKDGYDSFWFSQIAGYDALTLIALAGTRTERIALGTAVVPTYTRHPNVMAQQAMTANVASGGRLTLGIGPSHRPNIERLGFSYDRAALHTREYLTVLRSLVHEGKTEFHGQMYNLASAINVPGAQPFPILISALAPLMLKIAGELAEGTVTWMTGRKAIETHVAPKITAAAAAAGRPAPRIVVGLPVAVCDDEAEGRERAARAFQGYGMLVNYRRVLDIEGADPGDIAVCGPEASVERQLRAYASTGATELMLSVYPAGDDAAASARRTREFLNTLVGKL